MFEWLFPNWTNPHLLALIVAGRLLVDAALTALVARSLGRDAALTVAAAIVTVAAPVTMVLVLRQGLLGTHAANVELLAQLGLVVLAGAAVARAPTAARAAVLALVCAAALGLLLVSVPLYGEATVAP